MAPIESDDWRLTFYNSALDGATFRLQAFRTEGTWDHEHCRCCWQKITDHPLCPDADREGYVCISLPDCRDWICKECFADFREQMNFYLESEEVS